MGAVAEGNAFLFTLEIEVIRRLELGLVAVGGGNEHVLLLTLHHIIADGWSAGVLIHELRALYGALVREQP
ncbi:condensation domain-containing protein, partial [Stigmatella aurantiaca]|uniref:condensation domain-containing protein n=1 Tax=Stigmatella aurantiaca TaxID=41 RepID=UPI003B27BA9D